MYIGPNMTNLYTISYTFAAAVSGAWVGLSEVALQLRSAGKPKGLPRSSGACQTMGGQACMDSFWGDFLYGCAGSVKRALICRCCVAATVAEPVSPTPLNRSGRKHSDAKGSEALETGWDLFYRSGNSGSKAKPKPKVSSPKAPKAVSAARRNSAPPGNKEAADKTS